MRRPDGFGRRNELSINSARVVPRRTVGASRDSMRCPTSRRWRFSGFPALRLSRVGCPRATVGLGLLFRRQMALVLSTRLRRNRLVAIVAAITLIVGLCAFSAHGFGDRVHEDGGHCDLCGHFSGTAGSPAHASVVGKPVLVVRAPLERPGIIRSARRRVGTQLPRAPPVALELT